MSPEDRFLVSATSRTSPSTTSSRLGSQSTKRARPASPTPRSRLRTAALVSVPLPLDPRHSRSQLSFDDLGVPLSDATFCVLDIETTGGASTDGITELAAAKFRGGECLGEFRTFVNPGCPIPARIMLLTGISPSMVSPAPRIESVLESFKAFVGDSVICGHNVAFDLRFLNSAFRANSWAPFTNTVVDTCKLARRLVREEVPNCKLETLARHLGLPHQPTHRALDDVRATADLLHYLLERAASYGITGVQDLIEIPALNRHPQARKLRMTSHLPRCPGVYLFRDDAGKILYVGKATNLRSRVRSYFSTDDRRKVQPMLRQLAKIDHITCPTPIEAAVLENRLIQRELPEFNRHAKLWPQYRYIRAIGESKPKFSVTPSATGIEGAIYLGPFHSTNAARSALAALSEAVEIHGAGWRDALVHRPNELLEVLAVNMRHMAEEENFERAAITRDRAATLARGLDRQRKAHKLLSTGFMQIRLDSKPNAGGPVELRFYNGRLRFGPGESAAIEVNQCDGIPARLIDELTIVANWLDRAKNSGVYLQHCEGGLAFDAIPISKFEQRD